MHKDFLLVLSTCPDADTADRLARALLEAGLAACINVVPGLRSLYVWKGELQADAEVLLLIKTTAAKFPALREALVARHPYQLPEVIAVAIEEPAPPALMWLTQTVIGDQWAAFFAHHSTGSTARRAAGSGGRICVPRAMYSFSGSFCRLTV